MLFVVNIGNTHTQYGFFDDGVFSSIKVIPTEEFSGYLIPEDMPMAGACVVPAKKILFNTKMLWVSPNLNTGLDLTMMDVTTIGADRLSNAAALAKFCELPAICVDCGTAITFDIVDENLFYHGGAISPGRSLLRKALHNYTSQLPDVPIINKLKNTIGNNTVDAVLSGVDRGVVCLVEGMINHISSELGKQRCPVVLTGGDAGFFLKYLPDKCDIDVDFTLRGIASIWESAR